MKKLIFPFLILIPLNSKAQIDPLNQIVIANAGKVLASQNYILNFTLGEFVIATFESGASILTQGFHQPDSSDLLISIDENIGFGNEIFAYPNPTQNFIIVELNFAKERNIEIQLFDSLGRKLRSQHYLMRSGSVEIDITKYAVGLYYLEIKDKNELKIQSIKILKS